MKVIGVDIGGMSIKGGIVNDDGSIVETFQFPVDYQKNTPEEIISNLGNHILEIIKNNHVENECHEIGIGVPGVINIDKGTVDYSANLKWDKVPLVSLLEKQTGMEVRITNDANAAALGEAKFGAGKDYNSSITITIGTGIGGGVVIDGKLFEGNEGKGAELGHCLLVLDGEPCGCGRKGCFERYASASALMKQTREAMLANKETMMWSLCDNDINNVNGKVPFDAEKAGDKVAKQVIDTYIKYLGEGLLNYCNIFRPNAIILSGGVAKQGEYLISKLEDYCQKQHYGYKNAPAVKFVIAKLGYESGIIGGASLFL